MVSSYYLSFYYGGRRCTCHTCKNFLCQRDTAPCVDCLPGLERGGDFFCHTASGYDENPEFASETTKVHELKTLPQYFSSMKNFELRKNDRGFAVGDIVVLREWEPGGGYTGRYRAKFIQYILENAEEYGLADGYCILGLSDSSPL